MGFVIASVAGFDPLRIEAVAAAPYALTLWTYWQRDEAAYLDELKREWERIQMADMNAVAFGEPKKLARFEMDWRSRATRPAGGGKTLEELSRDADELWARHEKGRNRPVS